MVRYDFAGFAGNYLKLKIEAEGTLDALTFYNLISSKLHFDKPTQYFSYTGGVTAPKGES